MGKCMRKCRTAGGVAVMEVSPAGVRTRSRTLDVAAAGKRKRPAPAEFRARRAPERSPKREPVRIPTERRPRPPSNSASSRSSGGSSDLLQERLGSEDLAGLESVDFDCRERREATSLSSLRSGEDDMESGTRKSEENSGQKATPADKTLSREEIEEFFAGMEREQRRRFELKYNFDVEKEAPLEGRWEWARLK